jgi:predicted flap endonuclease-1-like 5' DNA nuclease
MNGALRSLAIGLVAAVLAYFVFSSLLHVDLRNAIFLSVPIGLIVMVLVRTANAGQDQPADRLRKMPPAPPARPAAPRPAEPEGTAPVETAAAPMPPFLQALAPAATGRPAMTEADLAPSEDELEDEEPEIEAETAEPPEPPETTETPAKARRRAERRVPASRVAASEPRTDRRTGPRAARSAKKAPGKGGAETPPKPAAADDKAARREARRAVRPASDAPEEGAARRGRDPSAPAAAKADAPAAAPAAGGDDLKQIKGVGPRIERRLNKLGITRFAQIAAWDGDEQARIDELLRLQGRMQREAWIEQAKTLAAGGETEFSARVKKGDVD